MPKAFVSYCWEGEQHREWVLGLATRLRADGVETILDQWHIVPGDHLPSFMERAVRQADFVLIVCTPRYKERSERRQGGVGYEGDIITGQVLTRGNERKFIPLLRGDEWQASAPAWLAGKYYIDLRGEPYETASYRDLLVTLLEARPVAPLTRSSKSAGTRRPENWGPEDYVAPQSAGDLKEQVLIVDDQIADTLWLVELIQASGCGVVFATNERAARSILDEVSQHKRRFRLAVVDIMLPAVDVAEIFDEGLTDAFFAGQHGAGLRICQYARHSLLIPETILPIVCFSGRDDTELRDALRQLDIRLFSRAGSESENLRSFVRAMFPLREGDAE